ncbi:glycosyltransferase family 2 protein [Halomonas kalidii]|uniref:Glycosyltransferase n=1 Tax=Halomonas kalidii TaxID=3043293 RepID=A0ABT6VKS9_9GAMM|nr:glycosyltransferase [Halomonas kalidii]MDI5934174.1 glycosyltransferase [Halomonas kalidii]
MLRKGDPAPHPLEPIREEDIVNNWASDEIMVSVICPTFQHADYIEDAIKGFLGQKTDFGYEVIIRDDCSTDGTREIVEKYQRAYPRIIRTILEDENRWPTVKALPILLAAVRGKYTATCDGDDYWIDEFKLQKQVEFLEKNPNVSLLRSKDVVVEEGVVTSPPRYGGTRTFMYPSRIEVPERLAYACYFGDVLLQAVLKSQGDIHTLDEVTAIWRKHSGGIFGGLVDKDIEFINLQRYQTNFLVAQYLYEQGDVRNARRYMVRSLNNIISTKPSEKRSIMTLLYSSCLVELVKNAINKLRTRYSQ